MLRISTDIIPEHRRLIRVVGSGQLLPWEAIMSVKPLAIAFLWPILLWAANAAATQESPSSHEQHHQAGHETLTEPQRSLTLQTPHSIATEHRELHETLARASKEAGEIGAAARELERALAPHFKREEEIATPPLGLLPSLARENPTADMRAVLPMTEALERELPHMLREHEVIRQAVTKFRAAAVNAAREEYVRFSDGLAAHARQEEEILYPAAVLVGRYVKRMTAEK